MVFVNEDELGLDDGYALVKRNKGQRKRSRSSGGQMGGESVENSRTSVRDFFATLDPATVSGSSAGENSDREDAQVRPTVQPTTSGINIDSGTVKDTLISIKLEGESRPFPSAPEVLEGLLKILQKESLNIDGAVRTGACFYQVRAGSLQQTETIVEALHNQLFLTWTISARKQGERVPMYVVLNAPFQITNTDITEALSLYGEVKTVREQKYRQWPSISNGHRSVSLAKITTPLPGNIKIKGCNLIVRQYGENSGNHNKRCHACGEEGHFKAKCTRMQGQRATVAPVIAKQQKRIDPVTEVPQVVNVETNSVAGQVGGGVRPGNDSPQQQTDRSVERSEGQGQVEGNEARPLPPPTAETAPTAERDIIIPPTHTNTTKHTTQPRRADKPISITPTTTGLKPMPSARKKLHITSKPIDTTVKVTHVHRESLQKDESTQRPKHSGQTSCLKRNLRGSSTPPKKIKKKKRGKLLTDEEFEADLAVRIKRMKKYYTRHPDASGSYSGGSDWESEEETAERSCLSLSSTDSSDRHSTPT